jgi:alpha-D-ribose 1-methylphosphonate 5-triphosphate synthase subunit PhnG
MAVMARASSAELSEVLALQGATPHHDILKPAEAGTVMIEGRAGGSGTRFNLGEVTVTRCVVRLIGGIVGVAYALGTDRRKVHLAALLDGILQTTRPNERLLAAIEVLATRQLAARVEASRKAAATKVEFFTLVRGDG